MEKPPERNKIELIYKGRKKTLEEITSDEAKRKRFIGGGGGVSVTHAAQMGLQYEKDFFDKVTCYHVRGFHDELQEIISQFQKTVSVDFYGENV